MRPLPLLLLRAKKPMLERIPYAGWANALRLSNGHVELIATLDVGPRVLSYRLLDGTNVLKEFPAQLGGTGEAGWMVRGGHRLWTAPEDLTRSYAPDNGPVTLTEIDGGASLEAQPDTVHGIEKEFDLRLGATGSGVELLHRITNIGTRSASLAAWALTVMAPGGTEILPLPAKRPHPGPPENARSADDYASNQRLVLWPFFDFADPRWTFGSRFIRLRQDAGRGPTKLGLMHREGWAAYHVGGSLFVKSVPWQGGRPYPDQGCNLETFTNEEMLEIETLGPLVELAPGETVEHVERWSLHALPGELGDEADVAHRVLPLLRRPGFPA